MERHTLAQLAAIDPEVALLPAHGTEFAAGSAGQRARSGGRAGRSAAGGRDNGQRGGRAESRPPTAVPASTWAAAKQKSIIHFSRPIQKGPGAGRGLRAPRRSPGRPPHPPTLLSFYVQADRQKAELAPPGDAERGRVRTALAHGTGQPARLLHYSGARFAAILPACA